MSLLIAESVLNNRQPVSGTNILELIRVATFSKLVAAGETKRTSSLLLSQAGFSLKDSRNVECDECGKLLNVFEISSSPSDERYHIQGCGFILPRCGRQEESKLVAVTNLPDSKHVLTEASGQTVEACHFVGKSESFNTGLHYTHDEGNDLTFDIENDGEESASTSVEDIFEEVDLARQPIPTTEHYLQVPGRTQFRRLNSDSSGDSGCISDNENKNAKISSSKGDQNKEIQAAQDEHSTASAPGNDVQQEPEASASSHPPPDSQQQEGQAVVLADFEAELNFSQEFLISPVQNCEKNPGHYSFFPPYTNRLDYLPSSVRHASFNELLQLFAQVTVRVIVQIKGVNAGHGKFRIGSGIAIKADKYQGSQFENTGKLNSFRKYFKPKRVGFVHIEICKNLVESLEEAQNTIVEFFYDKPDRQSIVTLKGVSIQASSLGGEHVSTLICKTHNLPVVDMVKQARGKIETAFASLPLNIKDGLSRRVFLISHPHGREKVFSFGESVMIKYSVQQMTENGQTRQQFVKISNHALITQRPEQLRKVLLYTADSCPGSSGGFLITARKIGSGDSQNYTLDLWMHYGVDKKHKLNISALREVTEEDIASHGQPMPRPSYQDEMSSEADRAANQVVSCPVFTVTQSPAYPAYAQYIKRLESYPASFAHVHTPANLANAGFFFAGYGDCVRCFHCGLGLRTWRPGDEIHTEHLKNRPDCQFLLLKLKESGIDALGLDLHTRGNSPNGGLPQTEQKASEQRPATGAPCLSEAAAAPVVSSAMLESDLLLTGNPDWLEAPSKPFPSQAIVVATAAADNVPRPASAIEVLQREQQYLKQLTICKVCFQKPVKDLFLPCGELVSCLDCSKLLTHCPSCQQKILATVTTYFG